MTCANATESALPASCFNFAMSWSISSLRPIESQWLSTSAIRSPFKGQRASPWLSFVHFVVLFIRRRLAGIWAEPKLNAGIMVASTFRSPIVAISRLILLPACFSQMQAMNSAANAKLYPCLIASGNSLGGVSHPCLPRYYPYITCRLGDLFCSPSSTINFASRSSTKSVVASTSCILASDQSLRVAMLGPTYPSLSHPELILCKTLYRSLIEWTWSIAWLNLGPYSMFTI